MANFNIYQTITDRMIAEMEKGLIPWRKPWVVALTGVKIRGEIDLRKIAFNRITKRAYSMLNQMLLGKAGEYASFKQWTEIGGKVKKGAKADIVVFWTTFDKEVQDPQTGKKEIVQIPMLRYYNVFHISQVEGVKPLDFTDEKQKPHITFEPEIEAEEMANAYLQRENISLDFGGDSAFYSPIGDYINIPSKESFRGNAAEFYSTLYHEIVHSTGHKSRLNRLSKGAHFGNEEYSKEELVAEIGSAGLLFYLGIETKSSFKNSTAYVQSWLRKLKSDNKFVISAAGQAEKAIDFIIGEVQA